MSPISFLFMNSGRKDTYGVYAEPVDPEEVCGVLLCVVIA